MGCLLPTRPGVTCCICDQQAVMLGLKLKLQLELDVEK